MGDDDHREARLGQILHDREHAADHLGVERGGRLVEEEDLRVHAERPRDRDALPLAARELGGGGADEAGHAHRGEQLLRLLLALLLAALQHGHLADHAVLQHAHVVEEVEGLEDHADLGAVLVDVELPLEDILAVEEDLAVVGDLKQVDAPEQGGLAAAGRADNGDHVPLVDVEVDVVEDAQLAKVLFEVFDLHDVFHHCAPPSGLMRASGTVCEVG